MQVDAGDLAEEMAMNEREKSVQGAVENGNERPAFGTQESEEMVAQELEFVPETQRAREASIASAADADAVDPAEEQTAMVVETEPISDDAVPKAATTDDGEITVLEPAAAPVNSAGRTRTARSTRNKTSSTNKRRPPISVPETTSTDPAAYHLTQKWIDRLPDFPEPRIVIVETSVPLRYDNTNLMSLDIPGVNKVFRKCTGCTLRQCECAPLPLTEAQESTPHAQYRQNSVLDAAGCLTCRICGVVCSFTLDPPIYGEFASLPSPRALDEMKLLPEDWDTRSTLDGFEGHDEVNGNGKEQTHPDPTFLQSNKCSGCILRQCLCIALPAGEGRGGGCVKCQECNVACSFGVATPKADGKTVVWADADSTKTGGRALPGGEKRTYTSKRRVLAAASDDEETRADEMQVDE
jgi:Fe-S-cluster-containing hydrogenase component 2